MFIQSLGFHSTKSFFHGSEDGKEIRMQNIKRAASYIPLIGSAIGVINLIKELHHSPISNEQKALRRYNLVRAGVQTASLGFLYLIPDLIVTIGRFCCNKKTATVSQPASAPPFTPATKATTG